MLEMLLDKKLLFVLMGMLTGLGVADKCICLLYTSDAADE